MRAGADPGGARGECMRAGVGCMRCTGAPLARPAKRSAQGSFGAVQETERVRAPVQPDEVGLRAWLARYGGRRVHVAAWQPPRICFRIAFASSNQQAERAARRQSGCSPAAPAASGRPTAAGPGTHVIDADVDDDMRSADMDALVGVLRALPIEPQEVRSPPVLIGDGHRVVHSTLELHRAGDITLVVGDHGEEAVAEIHADVVVGAC